MNLNIMTVSHLFSVLNRTTTYKAIISGGKQKNSSELPVSNNDFIKRVSGFGNLRIGKILGYRSQRSCKTKIKGAVGGHTDLTKRYYFLAAHLEGS